MRRRLDLAASLIVSPVLFVDDRQPVSTRPAAGIWAAIRSRVSAGTTVLLTTQYLEGADQLCDRISMLKAGRVIAEGLRRGSNPRWAGTGLTSFSPLAPTPAR